MQVSPRRPRCAGIACWCEERQLQEAGKVTGRAELRCCRVHALLAGARRPSCPWPSRRPRSPPPLHPTTNTRSAMHRSCCRTRNLLAAVPSLHQHSQPPLLPARTSCAGGRAHQQGRQLPDGGGQGGLWRRQAVGRGQDPLPRALCHVSARLMRGRGGASRFSGTCSLNMQHHCSLRDAAAHLYACAGRRTFTYRPPPMGLPCM